ncbi:MAG: ATP-binding cassette domain-containing protein [Myxococcales bacterium]|nr:ATP-binding cassette domain-containing protein [Myxococcales bacterium]
MNAIEVSQACKRYGATTAVSEVSFTVQRGEVIGLLGRNGAGKTTLMKMLTGYLRPDSGRIAVHGVDVVADPVAAQRHIGYSPENAPSYHDMTVQAYLGMIAELRGLTGDARHRGLADAIVATGLEERLLQPIGKLSKGFRQRVGIAQAIVHKPSVLILDEPTAGLDPTQVLEIRALIAGLAATATVLLSTHILGEVQANCRRVIIIERGQLCADRALAELTAQNAVIVELASDPRAEATLRAIKGVTGVQAVGAAAAGYQRWRVVAAGDHDLAAAIFAAVAVPGLAVRELRADDKTLEHVFAELAGAAAPSAARGARP